MSGMWKPRRRKPRGGPDAGGGGGAEKLSQGTEAAKPADGAKPWE